MKVFDLAANSEGAILLGSIVERYRKINNVPRRAIADLCSLSVEYIRLIETGKRAPVKSVLGRILSVCGANSNQIDWSYAKKCDLVLWSPIDNKFYGFNFVSRIKEARRSKKQMDQTKSDETKYNRAFLVEVLVYHQPTNTSACICGWSKLGFSHAEHVADMYEFGLKQYLIENRLYATPLGGNNE